MRKLSLLFVFVMLFALVFAFNTFATKYDKIPTEEITLEQTDGNADQLDLTKLVDGDYHTACTGGNGSYNWTNFHFKFAEGKNISKLFIVVNSTGTIYNTNEVHETLTENSFNLYVRLYDAENKVLWKKEDFAISSLSEEFTDAEGNAYKAITFDFPTTIKGVYKVEVAPMHNKNLSNCIWEVEMYEHECDETNHAFVDDNNCTTAVSCNVCGEVVYEAKLHAFDETTKLCTNDGCTYKFVGGCFSDYELGDLGRIDSYWGQSEVKDEAGNIIGGYYPGGNNGGDAIGALFDGTVGDGWAKGPAPAYWSDKYNITLFYADSHLIRETTIWYCARAEGHGYAIELSNDGGETWTEVGRFIATTAEAGTIAETTHLINDGAGMEANAYRLRWLGGYSTFNTTFTEVDIKASERLTCSWDNGVTTPATCGEDGKIVYTCTKCGDKKETVLPATGMHTWDEGVETKAPTTEEDGIMTYTCEVCGDTFEEKISAIQHVYEAEVIDPTCTEKGYTVYTCNGECGIENCADTYIDKDSYVEAYGHDYESEVTVKATALNTGVITYSCLNCGDEYEEVTAKLDWGDSASVIGPSNIIGYEETYTTADGKRPYGKCDPAKLFDGVINSTWTQNGAGDGWYGPTGSKLRITLDKEYFVISFEYAVWSNWNNATISFYDAENNLTKSTGNSTFNDLEVKRTEHVGMANATKVKYIEIYVNSAKGAKYGETEIITGDCLAFQEFWITVHNHTSEEQLDYIAPTCDRIGSYTEYCTQCGLTSYVEIPALGHTEGTAATCTTKAVCSVCEKEYGEPLGHTVGTAATCTTKAVCLVCNEEYGEPLGHNYEAFVTLAPTCMATGTTEYTCLNCGDKYTEETTADLESDDAHNYWPDWETMKYATCIEGGYEKLTCENCGNVKEVFTDPDTENGHDWKVNMETYKDATCLEDGYRERTCLLCDKVDENTTLDKTIFGSHNYVLDEESFVEATCQADGYRKDVCSVCYDEIEETIPASEWLHDYVPSANGGLQTCSICKDYYFAGELLNSDSDYIVYFFGSDTFNVCTLDGSFDVYYTYEITSIVDGVYTIVLTANEGNDDVLCFVGGTATFTVSDDGVVATVVSVDENKTTYTFDNFAEEEEPASFEGMYSGINENDEMLVLSFADDGYVYVLENTTTLELEDSYAYIFNPMQGRLAIDFFPAMVYYDVTSGIVYINELALHRVGNFVIPEKPVNYGDKIGSIEAETTAAYEAKDLYSYTAAVKGQYSFFFPAGLGAIDKAAYDAQVNGQDGVTPIINIDYFSNTDGKYAVLNLEAGETVEFYITATTVQAWTIDVYYYIEMAEAELVLGENEAEVNTSFTYNVTADGTLTLTVEAVDGNVTFSYSVNGGDAVVITDTAEIEVVASDVVVVEAIVDEGAIGYITAEWADKVTDVIDNSALNGTYYMSGNALVFADGVLTMNGETYNYTYNATQKTLTVEGLADGMISVVEGEIWYRGRVKLHQHNEDEIVKKVTDPTCTAAGYTTYICPFDCGVLSTGDEVDALGHSYNATVTKPTCSTAGYTTHTCTVCGDSYTDSTVESTGHTYETTTTVESTCSVAGSVTSTCTVCGDTKVEDLPLAAHTEVEIPAVPGELRNPGMTSGVKCSVCETVIVAPVTASSNFRFAAVSLTLSDNVNIQYKVMVPAGYENVRVVFTMNGVETEVTDYEIEASSGRYVFVFRGIRLQYMADLVTATVYAENNGVTSANSYSNYSVKTYIVNNMTKTSNNSALRTMLANLLLLGDAAQVYANYNADTLMSADVDEELIKELAIAYNGIPSSEFVQKMIINNEETRSIADWKSVSLLSQDAMALQFKLAIDKAEINNIEIKVTIPVYGKEPRIDTYTAEDMTYSASENRYILVVPGLKVVQYSETVVGEIYYKNADGTTSLISRTVNYSVNSYAQKNQDSSNAGLCGFLRALYLYGKAADAYAGKK